MSVPSSIPAAIDGLLAIINARSEITANNVQVWDGFPTAIADNMITVGGSTNNTAQGVQSPAQLGGFFREEDYTLEVTISTYSGGNNSTAQKSTRDMAFSLFEAVANGVRADATLGGAVRYAQVMSVDYKATDEETASNGRYSILTVGIRCQQRIAP